MAAKGDLMRTRHLSILLAALMAGFGCDDNPPANADGGVVDDAGGGDVDGGTDPEVDGGGDSDPDGGSTGDGNDDFGSATPIEIIPADSTEGTLGVIDPAGDVDYYTFEGTEGQWIQIVTAVDDSVSPRADTAITLFDASMTQIADNDDSLPRTDTNAGLITRLPADGTYYLLVQEWSTWADDTPVGGPEYQYVVAVLDLTADADEVNIDAEGGDDAASAQALSAFASTGGSYSLILGTFEDATDVDVYSFTIPAGDAASYSVNLMPSGASGSGSAGPPARLWVTNADGSEIIARNDPSAFTDVAPGTTVALSPSLGADSTYLLFVEAGEAGDFYVLKAFRGGDNPPETMDGTNGDPATPETIALAANPNAPGTRSGFVLASLGDGDVDHFSITTMGDEVVSVACGSRSLGSGVVDLTATLLDSTGATEIASATESETVGVRIINQAVPAAGEYLVRLTKGSQDSEVVGDWVRCGIHVAPPAP